MINLDNIYEVMYSKLVGEIPQVADAFFHYYGKEKIDFNILKDNIKLNSVEEYIKYLECVDWSIPLNNLNDYYLSNTLLAIKLKSLIVNNTLIFTQDFFDNTSEESINIIVGALIKMSYRHYEGYKIIGNILIHFPEIKVTNENDTSTIIYDLYAKIIINKNGTIEGYPEFCKATYTQEQWNASYIHSHMRAVRKDNPELFKNSCLGSGPLSNTIPALRLDGNLNLWPLFCLELDRYLQVESLEGGPYIRISSISNKIKKQKFTKFKFNTFENVYINTSLIRNNSYIKNLMSLYIKHLLRSGKLNFVWVSNKYSIGMDFLEILQTFSSEFIIFYNNLVMEDKNDFEFKNYYVSISDLLNNRVLLKGKIDEAKFIHYSSENINREDINEINLFTFKNAPVKLKIIEEINSEENSLEYFVNPELIDYILKQILNITNNGKFFKQLNPEKYYSNNTKGFTF
jgi:hypothetical protein